MEEWRQCGRWLIDCKVLPPNHRVVWPSAAVFDLAQALRDGVLLCQMLHNLSPGSVDLKEINFRPQMSQVSCKLQIDFHLQAMYCDCTHTYSYICIAAASSHLGIACSMHCLGMTFLQHLIPGFPPVVTFLSQQAPLLVLGPSPSAEPLSEYL